MSLEELLIRAWSGETIFSEMLAKFQGTPAVFYRTAPKEDDAGWNTVQHYPQILFDLQRQENPARKSAGLLEVRLIGDGQEKDPEELEPYVKALFQNRFFVPEQESPSCFVWLSTGKGRIQEAWKERRIVFDLLQYPLPEGQLYEPVAVLRDFLKRLLPDVRVAGLDPLPEEFSSETTPPLLYCRLVSAKREEETHTFVRMNVRLAIHIFSPSLLLRLKLAASAAEGLSLAGELRAGDGTPMQITGVRFIPEADYRKEGELYVGIRYGLPRPEQNTELLQKIGIELN